MNASAAVSPATFREWTYTEEWQKQIQATRQDETQCMQALCWNKDRNLLWGCTKSGELCLWNVPKKNEQDVAPERLRPIWRCRFPGSLRGLKLAPQTQRLVIAGSEGLWVLDSSESIPSKSKSTTIPEKTVRLKTYPSAWATPTVTETCIVGPDENTVLGVARPDDFGVYQWDISTCSITSTKPPSRQGVRITTLDYCYHDDENASLCQGDSDGSVTLWDANSHELKTSFSLAQNLPVEYVRFISPEWLVAVYNDKSGGRPSSLLVTWHISTHSMAARASVQAKIQSMRVFGDKVWIGANDGYVSIFTALDLQLQRRIAVAASPSVHAIEVSDTLIAVAGLGSKVEIWDTDCLLCHRLSL